jgi:hypothetical protein
VASGPNGGGQLETIHGARHLDIGEDDCDVQAAFKYEDFVCVLCFDYIEAGGSNHIDRVHAGQELVFHDQTTGRFVSEYANAMPPAG